MRDIISWYNRNRKKVFITIIFVGIVAILIFTLLRSAYRNLVNRQEETIVEPNINTEALNSIAMSDNKSVIGAGSITSTQKELTVLDEFISYCNSGKIQEAYSLLSDECKQEMFSDVNIFKKNYYDNLFNGKTKNVKIENWIKDIYMLYIREDALATGKYSEDESTTETITIVKDKEGNPKLNINNYIGRNVINKSINKNNLSIKLIQSDSYMDYEYYTFEIKNNTRGTVTLCDVEDDDSTYLIDRNGLKYTGYMHELSQLQLVATSGETKIVRIKYFNQFSSSRKIKKLVLKNVYLNSYVSNNETHGISTTYEFEL